MDERRFAGGAEEAPYLGSFLAVAEELHFGRAAERLNVAQPTLSRRIRLLEEELGTLLFDRTSQPVRLTPAGRAFREDAELAVHHGRRAREQALRAARGELGRISVGATSWANNAVVPQALRAFRATAPSVSLELYTTAPGDQVEALHKQRLDVGFSAFARWLTGRPGLDVEPLLEEPMVAILPRDHRLARQRTVSLEDLAAERFVALADSVAPGLVNKQVAIFHERGLSPADVQETTDPWALMTLIAGGVGVGLHMASFSNVAHRGLAFVELEGDAPTATLFMLSRRDDDRELVRRFLATTREVARSLEPATVLG
jgi:DNA-binding transcriptional LysR family regulator